MLFVMVKNTGSFQELKTMMARDGIITMSQCVYAKFEQIDEDEPIVPKMSKVKDLISFFLAIAQDLRAPNAKENHGTLIEIGWDTTARLLATLRTIENKDGLMRR